MDFWLIFDRFKENKTMKDFKVKNLAGLTKVKTSNNFLFLNRVAVRPFGATLSAKPISPTSRIDSKHSRGPKRASIIQKWRFLPQDQARSARKKSKVSASPTKKKTKNQWKLMHIPHIYMHICELLHEDSYICARSSPCVLHSREEITVFLLRVSSN